MRRVAVRLSRLCNHCQRLFLGFHRGNIANKARFPFYKLCRSSCLNCFIWLNKNPFPYLQNKNRKRCRDPASLVFAEANCLHTKTLFKSVNTSAGIIQLLTPGEKRMAFGAYLNSDIFFRRTGFDNLAASTSNRGLFIVRMNSLFHFYSPLSTYGLAIQYDTTYFVKLQALFQQNIQESRLPTSFAASIILSCASCK